MKVKQQKVRSLEADPVKMVGLEFDALGFEKALRLVKAMDNRHRLFILCLMCEGGRSVTEMAEATGLSLSAMSQHLTVLKDAELVVWEKSGPDSDLPIADHRGGKSD
ncbi:MAG: metalloregulator ArsR/SmtB family transcription factor [Verrucomicrobia bacterium]|nr:metalloregulator ArsR/SmtB family transcription factor [Verrucomicrobiota bacterium]